LKWTQWKSYITYGGKWNSISTFRTYFPFWSQIHVRYQHIIRVNVYFMKNDAGMAVHFIWAKMTFLRIYRETLWYFTSKVRWFVWYVMNYAIFCHFSVSFCRKTAWYASRENMKDRQNAGGKNESNIDFIFKFKENFVF
jgi:hypothetical protein